MNVTIVKKSEVGISQLKGIIQIDFTNMGENEDEANWNLVTFLTRNEDGKLEKTGYLLSEISQLIITETKAVE